MGSQLTNTHSRGKEGQPWASGQGESSQGSKSTTVSVLTCSTVAMSTHSMIMLSVIVLHFSSLTLACKPASEKTPTEVDSVLLITGGYTGGGETASTEEFPSTSGCSSPPQLPLPRAGHQTFKTSDPTPLVASCGGFTGGDYTASCLVLDLENQRWDESRMGNLTMPRDGGAVVELKQGVLFLGGVGSATSKTTSDFLATGSLQWQQGPRLPQAMSLFCAVPVSPTKFLTIKGDKIHEFDAAIAGPSEEGWRDSTLWPTLKTSREDPGCAKIGNKVILAGGNSGGGVLQSTLVLDITTRTISTGGDMAAPRMWFNLATISRGGGETTFAIAGESSSGWDAELNSVEEWEEESSTWKAAGNLDTARSYFGVVTIQKNIICPT